MKIVSDQNIEIVVDRASAVPLYFQVARQLKAAIAEGRLLKGEFLTNEIELADRWNISRPTVRQAIKQLVDDGLLMRRRGVGTQIISDELRRPARLTSLYDDLTAAGRNPTTEVLTLERVAADRATAKSLGLAAGAEVVHIERCRIGGSKRLAIMRNWLTVESAGTITVASLRSNGLYELIRARGFQPHSAHQIIGATSASPTDAALLGLPVGAPLLTMRRVMQDLSGRIVEVGHHVYDAAQYSLEMTVLEN